MHPQFFSDLSPLAPTLIGTTTLGGASTFVPTTSSGSSGTPFLAGSSAAGAVFVPPRGEGANTLSASAGAVSQPINGTQQSNTQSQTLGSPVSQLGPTASQLTSTQSSGGGDNAAGTTTTQLRTSPGLQNVTQPQSDTPSSDSPQIPSVPTLPNLPGAPRRSGPRLPNLTQPGNQGNTPAAPAPLPDGSQQQTGSLGDPVFDREVASLSTIDDFFGSDEGLGLAASLALFIPGLVPEVQGQSGTARKLVR